MSPNINYDTYANEVDVTVSSVLSGEHTEVELLSDLRESELGVLREWAVDDDLQYLKIVSTNIGFIRVYQKRYAGNVRAEKGSSDG